MVTPLTFLKVQTDTGVVDIPIYNVSDVAYSAFRIMTNVGIGCFDLTGVSTPFKIMTSVGVKGINTQLISNPTDTPTIVENFLDNTYNFAFTQNANYPWNRFDTASPNGNLGHIKSSNQGSQASNSSITFTIVVPTTTATSRVEVDYVVDSEVNFDYFYLQLNGIEKLKVAKLNFIGTASIPLTAGTHLLELRFNKDTADNGGTDSAYVSEIRLFG